MGTSSGKVDGEKGKPGRPRSKSVEDLTIIHKGATVSDLQSIFGGSSKDVHRKIMGRVAPCTLPDEYPVRFRIGDAAPFLVNPAHINLEDVIKGLTPAKLPPMLQDAFWKAQRNRQNFEAEQGHLWNTERVVEALGKAFKPVRMQILMFKSEVAQREELTHTQRAVIESMADSLLAHLHTSLIEEFENYQPPADEHGMPLTDEERSILDIEDERDDGFDDGFGAVSGADDGFD